VLQNFLRQHYPTIAIEFSIEQEPLGTGGAIQLAASFATAENLLVANGDTLFKIDVETLANFSCAA